MSVSVDELRVTAFRGLFGCYDRLWRRLHRVQRIDALLSLSLGRYRGPVRIFPGGVRLQPGDRLGILHFNHDFFTDPAADDPGNRHGALRFRRQLFRSLAHLARRVEEDPRLGAVRAFHGVNWFRPHGASVGFVVEPLPDGLRTRLLVVHFRLLLRALFPVLARQRGKRLQPHAYWQTRGDLLARFGSRGGAGP